MVWTKFSHPPEYVRVVKRCEWRNSCLTFTSIFEAALPSMHWAQLSWMAWIWDFAANVLGFLSFFWSFSVSALTSQRTCIHNSIQVYTVLCCNCRTISAANLASLIVLSLSCGWLDDWRNFVFVCFTLRNLSAYSHEEKRLLIIHSCSTTKVKPYYLLL